MHAAPITLSVVSHRQNALLNAFLRDLAAHCPDRVHVLATENVPDPEPIQAPGLSLEQLRNPLPKGFGANHNAAFARCSTPYFCVANPDVRLGGDPFPALLRSLERPDAAVAGPLVRSPAGAIEDSARRFPTVRSLAAKLLSGAPGPDYPVDRGELAVDWVAGMFMLFRSDAYRDADGFDERYFLYYEDVDLCRRLGRAGRRVIYNPAAQIVHDARRASRRNLGYARHHAASLLRFLLSG